MLGINANCPSLYSPAPALLSLSVLRALPLSALFTIDDPVIFNYQIASTVRLPLVRQEPGWERAERRPFAPFF